MPLTFVPTTHHRFRTYSYHSVCAVVDISHGQCQRLIAHYARKAQPLLLRKYLYQHYHTTKYVHLIKSCGIE
jgi:hypothetical protein